jgi:hypothetical protein
MVEYPVILDDQVVQGPGVAEENHEILSKKQTESKRPGGLTQVTVCLPHKALSSNPSATFKGLYLWNYMSVLHNMTN